MTYPTDHAGLEVLPFDTCLRLLTTVPVGRIGFFADGELVILPVNHLVDGQDVVFRTAAGSKLSAAENGDVVAFEVDSYDDLDRSGWSVVVNGFARRAAALVVRARIWLRDEEAAGSNPATPTQVTGHIRLSGMASYIGG